MITLLIQISGVTKLTDKGSFVQTFDYPDKSFFFCSTLTCFVFLETFCNWQTFLQTSIKTSGISDLGQSEVKNTFVDQLGRTTKSQQPVCVMFWCACSVKMEIMEKNVWDFRQCLAFSGFSVILTIPSVILSDAYKNSWSYGENAGTTVWEVAELLTFKI